MPVAVFEGVDHVPHDPVIASDGAGAVVIGWGGCSRGGDRQATGVERQRYAETIAQRRTNEINCAPADRADGVFDGQRLAAGQAQGRHDGVGEISQRRCEGRTRAACNSGPEQRFLGIGIGFGRRGLGMGHGVDRTGSKPGRPCYGTGEPFSKSRPRTRMTEPPRIFDREILIRRRDRVAVSAEKYDFLLAQVADDLAEQLAIVQREFAVAANIGAYHGLLSRRLRPLPNVGLMFDVELSPRLLERCEGPRLAADEEMLPFADATLDLVVCGLSLQFVNDLPGALLQIRRALKPDGLFLAAMLGGTTLPNSGKRSWPPRRR